MVKTVPYSNAVTLKSGSALKADLFKMPKGYTNFIGTITITPISNTSKLTTLNVTVEPNDKVSMQGCIIHNKLKLGESGIPVELPKVVLGGTDKVCIYLIDTPPGTVVNVNITGILENNPAVIKSGSLPLNALKFTKLTEIFRVTSTNTAYCVMDLVCSGDPAIGKGSLSVYKSNDAEFITQPKDVQDASLFAVLSPFNFVHHCVNSITVKPGERLYVKSDITGVNVNILRMEIDGRIEKD